MKHILHLILTATLLGSTALAADNHKHEHKVAGPQGGRIIDSESGHAELFIQPDRKVAVTFLDDKLKPVAPGEQVVALTAQAPSGSARLEFEKADGKFVSKTALPEGDGYMIVLQLKSKSDAKPRNLRIKLDLGLCGGCKLAEYACICEGHNH